MRYYDRRKIDLKKVGDWVYKNRKKIGAGLGVALGISLAGNVLSEYKKPVTSIVKVVDNEKDEYQGNAPLYGSTDDKKVITTIDDNTLGIVEGKVKARKMYKISFMDADANIQEGYIEGKYLETLGTLENDKAEKYSKIYEVTPENGVNIRKSTKITDSNKIMAIGKEECVLGSETYEASTDNTFSWVPVVYINDEELVEGYIAKDFLKEIDKENERMLVDTSKDENVPLNLRQEPSKKANILEKIEDGSEVYVIASSQEIEEDGIIWKEIEYFNEQNGEVKNGWVSSEFLKKIEDAEKDKKEEERNDEEKNSEQEKQLIVDTSHVGGINLNVREGTGTNTKKIGSIQNGSKVTILEGMDASDSSWVRVSYIDDETGEQREGWVSTAYLKEKEPKIKKQVDTSSDSYVNLKMREKPSLDGKIKVEIPNGTIITINSEDLENTVNEDNYDWVKIQLEDGTEGYVAQKYLVDYEEREEEIQNGEEISIAENSEEVIGIDVSTIEPQILDQLLKGEIQIPNTVNTANLGELDLSKYNNKDIKYVYLKLGATGYGTNFSFVDFENYKELAKICEENKVPYGFYYYSTCINNEEAEQEAKRIEMLMDSLESKKYNVLPLAIDIELVSNGDRQARTGITQEEIQAEIDELTKVKAYLTNLVESTQGKTILYTSRNVVEVPTSKIMDLSEYNDLIESGDSDVWFVVPEGNTTHGQSLENILQTEDASVTMKQIVQDGILPNGSGYDIDVMTKDMYIKYTKAIETETIENIQEQQEER